MKKKYKKNNNIKKNIAFTASSLSKDFVCNVLVTVVLLPQSIGDWSRNEFLFV